jgi:TIR domain
MASKYEMPKKIPSYVRRLELMYRSDGSNIYHQIVCNASVYVREEVSYDNWNGGTAGHALVFFLEEDVLQKISNFEAQKKICKKLEVDFQECSQSLQGEFVEKVFIELYDENDLECMSSIKPFNQPIINPDTISVWRTGHIRLFISHRDEYKRQASELGLALKGYGISSFVAHDTIEPMEKWQHIIRKSLQSMEIMLVFITNGFFESFWTNQEVGVALGRGIPIIPVKMQKCDPCGFINDTQALIGDLDNPTASVDGIYKVLVEKLGQEERIRKATVQAFVDSSNFNEVTKRFNRLQAIRFVSEADIQQIIEAFSTNENLHNAWYLTNEHNRLVNFLENRMGKHYKIEGKSIKQIEAELDDEVPF